MDLSLQPLASACYVSGQPFSEGARVLSFLVRNATGTEVMRYDVAEAQAGAFAPQGMVACRWAHVFKARRVHENPERELKLTAETLFLTLADPAVELAEENRRLVQFLALMLERKKVLRPKGRSADGARNVFEHAKTKQLFEVPAGELNPEFFLAIQDQLSALVGGGKKPAGAVEPPVAGVAPTPVSPS